MQSNICLCSILCENEVPWSLSHLTDLCNTCVWHKHRLSEDREEDEKKMQKKMKEKRAEVPSYLCF